MLINSGLVIVFIDKIALAEAFFRRQRHLGSNRALKASFFTTNVVNQEKFQGFSALNSVGVMPLICLNARLNGPIEP